VAIVTMGAEENTLKQLDKELSRADEFCTRAVRKDCKVVMDKVRKRK